MAAFLIHNMAPIMFAALVVVLLIGYPVAFSLAFVGLAFGLLGIWLDLFPPTFLQALPERVFGVMSTENLLAIPFFTFMGLILERSGMAEGLLDTAGKLFGPIRGGVAYAVIFVGALLAATTGVVAASVMAMGLISLPIMLRYGYDRKLATGVIAASGTLAQIIPPSLVLIVMADQLGRPVGDMYKGAIIPGLVLTGLYALYVFLTTVLFPRSAPALPPEARSFGDGAPYRPVMRASVFPLALVVWGMIVLFDTPLGVAIIRDFLPGVAERVIDPFASEGAHMVVALAVFATLYFIYVGLLRLAPKPLAVLAALLLIVCAILLFGRTIGDLAAGLGALPLFGAGWFPAVAAWLAAEWTAILAILALIAASAALITAPSRPISAAVWKIVGDLLPPLILIFLVLGTIFQGIATPTEGGAMGAVGALVLALLRRRLSFRMMSQALDATTKLSSFVLFILIGARVFSLTFYGVDGHIWVEEWLVSLPGGEIGFLIFVNLLVFVLAFFLDFFELAFILVPLLAGPAERLGIDLIWFGVILGVNMQTSFMHPPFGFALFYLRSVAPRATFLDRVTGMPTAPVTTGQIYWGAVPFVVIQVIMIGLTIAFPGMVTHYKAGEVVVDPASIRIDAPSVVPEGLPSFGSGQPPAPNFGPAPGPDFGPAPTPELATPPPNFGPAK